MSPMNCPVCDKPTWHIMGGLHEIVDIIPINELHQVSVTFKPHECPKEKLLDAADLVPRRELNAVFKSLAEERRERIGESDEARAQVAVLREALKWALAYAAPAVEGRDYSAPLPITKDKLAQARAALTDTAAAAAPQSGEPEGK